MGGHVRTVCHNPQTASPHPRTVDGASPRTVDAASPHLGSVDAASPADVSRAGPRLEFRHKARFVWKVSLLLVTFVALIPVLLYQHELGAKVYLWFLVGVHVVGLAVFSWGVSRHDIAPSTRGFVGRLAGLVAVAGLLYLLSQGLTDPASSLAFWGTLFAVWAVHSAGLLLLHLRGRNETTCPFA